MKTARELESEARSNHDAAARALRMARGVTRASEIERLERFAAELEARANELDALAASAAQAAVGDASGPADRRRAPAQPDVVEAPVVVESVDVQRKREAAVPRLTAA